LPFRPGWLFAAVLAIGARPDFSSGSSPARRRRRVGSAVELTAIVTRSVTQLPLFWRVFAVNAALLAFATLLLLFAPVTVSVPIRLTEALVLMLGLAVALAANVFLLRRAFSPLDRLARRMETVDLLRPGQRLPASRHDEVGRVVHAFNEMLDRLELERRESGRRALAAQEAERLRIARGLHDEVGQVLTGVILQLDVVAEAVESGRRHELLEAKETVRRALEEVRRISRELRPEMLEHLGLVSALTELARTFSRISGIEVDRSFPDELPPLTREAELAIYRIAQESLTNVARHSSARRVRLTLEGGADSVVLRVADDGVGFRGGIVPEGHGGLRGMRERAVLLGAALAVKPSRDGGVEVRLEVPSSPVEAPEEVTA
jgi:two-component system sensor histidine kinase UhpB